MLSACVINLGIEPPVVGRHLLEGINPPGALSIRAE